MMKSVKREVEIVELEGLASLLGERVFVMCASYTYEGELVGVNDECILFEDACIIYETGPWDAKEWKDVQKLPGPHYVQKSFIESFGKNVK